MNFSFLISADEQMDATATWNVGRYRGDAGDWKAGSSWFSPWQCPCNFPALQGLLVQTCLKTELGEYTWEISWQILTSFIRAGCNTGRNHRYSKKYFLNQIIVWLTSKRAEKWRKTGPEALFNSWKQCLLTNVSYPLSILHEKWKDKEKIPKI